MFTGYPRYFPQPAIQKLCAHFIKKLGRESESCRPFPSKKSALRCLQHLQSVSGTDSKAHVETETIVIEGCFTSDTKGLVRHEITIAAVFASGDEFEIVKEYWKLTGECVSSRLATFFNQLLTNKDEITQEIVAKVISTLQEGEAAKEAIKKRIAKNHCDPFGLGRKIPTVRGQIIDTKRDVQLVSTGMSAIFTARNVLAFWEERRSFENASTLEKSLNEQNEAKCDTVAILGLPFKDTRVLMETFGTCQFFGISDSRGIAELQNCLSSRKNRFLAVFVETPSNPLLNVPDLDKLRKLADEYGFFIVIDDTIGGLNVDILPYADIVCTSLTKLFSGTSNVMGGSVLLNPDSSLYPYAQEYFQSCEFEDLLWSEDAVVLEANSRDFEARTLRTNENTVNLLTKVLLPEEGKLIKKVYYPTVSSEETFKNYERVRNRQGGYGCLFSIAFHNEEDAKCFYDSLKVFKGPSNGTNFTLACPYVHLAHHFELVEVAELGADPNLVRVSVGLEEFQGLREVFLNALEVTKQNSTSAA